MTEDLEHALVLDAVNSVVLCCYLEKYMVGCPMLWQETWAIQNKDWYGRPSRFAENHKMLWKWCYYDGNTAGDNNVMSNVG